MGRTKVLNGVNIMELPKRAGGPLLSSSTMPDIKSWCASLITNRLELIE